MYHVNDIGPVLFLATIQQLAPIRHGRYLLYRTLSNLIRLLLDFRL